MNLHGNRRLNHALHIVAITQLRHDSDSRRYHLRKIAEGATLRAPSSAASARRAIASSGWGGRDADPAAATRLNQRHPSAAAATVPAVVGLDERRIKCKPVLGGLIHEYHHAA